MIFCAHYVLLLSMKTVLVLVTLVITCVGLSTSKYQGNSRILSSPNDTTDSGHVAHKGTSINWNDITALHTFIFKKEDLQPQDVAEEEERHQNKRSIRQDLSKQSRQDLSSSEAYTAQFAYDSGDFILGGMFAVYIPDSNSEPCAKILQRSGMWIESVLYAIDVINNSTDCLPDITLGFEIRDDCSDPNKALEVRSDFKFDKFTIYSFLKITQHFCFHYLFERVKTSIWRVVLNFYFLTPLSQNLKCFILMQTPLQLDIWLQSYEGFDNGNNNMKQRNLNTVFANISKQHPRHPTHSS